MAPQQSEAPMPFFSSNRERRLWLWTLAVVVAIYSTLGLASTLARALPQSLAAVGFLGAMLLVGLTVLTQGLKARPRGAEIAVAIGVAVVYFMVFFRMAIPERSHLIEYGVVAVFIYEALSERKSQGRRVPIPALLAILATSLVGVLDECIQAILPSRVFEWVDILFNVLAALMATVASVSIGWARRLASRSRRS
jgi:hypothetical protein